MKLIFTILLFTLLFSCNSKVEKEINYRTNFSSEETKILQVADSIIKSAYYTTLITLGCENQPKARIVEPFLPEKNHVIWMATNPKSRKVIQLKNNSKTTLHYFDKSKLAYVSLMGNAYLVNDDAIKNEKWKDGWEKFYPNKNKDFILIKFIPKTIELISISANYFGDEVTWKPHQVVLY